MAATAAALADRLEAVLPQTQCTRCGYPDCRRYAEAMAERRAPINRCPPGGAEGIARLAAVAGGEVLPLDPACGREGPRSLAVIDEAWCIGCTLCIKACPVDCIVGASKWMHTVIAGQCTGCELCVAACPVDCIAMVVDDATVTGWAAWSPARAGDARERYRRRNARLADAAAQSTGRAAIEIRPPLHPITVNTADDESALRRKQAIVASAIARARAKTRSG